MCPSSPAHTHPVCSAVWPCVSEEGMADLLACYSQSYLLYIKWIYKEWCGDVGGLSGGREIGSTCSAEVCVCVCLCHKKAFSLMVFLLEGVKTTDCTEEHLLRNWLCSLK